MPNSREIATIILCKVYSGLELEGAISKNKSFFKLDRRDRSFVMFLVQNTLRRHAEIDEIISLFLKKPLKKKDFFIQNLLRISVLQIIFHEIPDYSAVDCAVEISKKRGMSRLINALLRNICRQKNNLFQKTNPVNNLPKWLLNDLNRNFGKECSKEIAYHIKNEPPLDIKLKENEIKKRKWGNLFSAKEIYKGLFRLEAGGLIEELPFYSDGLWWVQGLAATFPVEVIKTIFKNKKKSQVSVLDVCAAPGGKTCQLIDLGFNVHSIDISSVRISKLKENEK